MGLGQYRKKRDFRKTPEPRGRARRAKAGRSFVVQKHAARRLHHDFRLELDGVLLSWAVPKGPPTEPGEKVLAVRTEDHPIEYGDFEGVIPRGEYGGGTVMLWDRGEWRPKGDARRGLEKGALDFELAGERLRGRWTLTRMRGDDDDNWLLIKRSDDGGDARAAPPDLDESVVSGRTMAEIANDADRTWSGKEEDAGSRPRAVIDPSAVEGARAEDMPDSVEPQLATLVQAAPQGERWLHELKFDGYRLLAFRDGESVRLRTRRGQDWTERFPEVARAIGELPIEHAVLDGEVVVLDANGSTDFQALQNSLDGDAKRARHYYAFDLLHVDGFDLTGARLIDRKELLERVLAGAGRDGTLRYSEHVLGRGPDFHRNACDLSLEGIVSKRIDARYEERRSKSWVKVKCLRRQEFVVGGFTEPSGSRTHFGALLLGVFDDTGALRYCGRVGTGFTARSLADVDRRLRRLERRTPAFVDPPKGSEARGAHWTKPECVVEVAFTEWTKDGALRHPSFQGVREDKEPGSIRRERPAGGRESKKPPASSGVRLTNPDRVLYPEQGVTKRELADYHERVAPLLLPHVVGRPLTLVRCPRGRAEKCFYQKHVTESLPEPVRPVRVPEKSGTRDYVAIDDVAGLVTLVQMSVLELHPWGSRAEDLDHPDRIVLDIDPGPKVAWKSVVETAKRARQLLDVLALRGFPRTTGGKGLHVVVPIEPTVSWSEAKSFARAFAAAIAETEPDLYVLTSKKSVREERIFLDYLRNDRGSTAVASWSPRARPGAPVAVPLRWSEVEPSLDPAVFDVRNVPDRIEAEGDPWEGFFEVRQRITGRMLDALAAG